MQEKSKFLLVFSLFFSLALVIGVFFIPCAYAADDIEKEAIIGDAVALDTAIAVSAVETAIVETDAAPPAQDTEAIPSVTTDSNVVAENKGADSSITAHSQEKRNISIRHDWSGEADSSAEVTLVADGVDIQTMMLTHETGWQHVFSDLEKYHDDREIQYSVRVTTASGDSSNVTGDMQGGFVATPLNLRQARDAGGLEKVDVKITNFTITKENWHDPNPPTVFGRWSELKLLMDWDASVYGKSLKSGDYFNIILPENMKFPSNHTATHFDVLTPDGIKMGNGEVFPNGEEGGTVRVTFNEWVENKYDVKGQISLAAFFGKIVADQLNEFVVKIGTSAQTIQIEIQGEKPWENNHFAKWGNPGSNDNEVKWRMTINHAKGNHYNVVIHDQLYVKNGDLAGMHYLPEKFELWRVTLDELGKIINRDEQIDLADKIVFNDAKTAFTLNMKNSVAGKQYILLYYSTYVPGVVLRNSAELKSDIADKKIEASFKDAVSSGSGQGSLLSKIKLIKVDEENHQQKLPNAVFIVTNKATGESFELTTDANGEAISDKLIPGTYEVIEKVAPKGYILDSQTVYVLNVTADEATLKTITNKPITISVDVQKKWIGPKRDKVLVHLLADGKKVQEYELNNANTWRHTFEGLRKYNADGTLIKYSVEEADIPEGYEAEVKPDGEGYVITNKNVEKVNIPVEKRWIGRERDKVTIRLYADQVEIQVKELSPANGWKHLFENLDKYTPDGKLIEYSITEDDIRGYNTTIEGNPAQGYVIINKKKPSSGGGSTNISIDVNKVWIGGEAESITIKLLADGKEKESYILNADNKWKHTFNNLPKYDGDREIQYSIEEEKVEGYTSKITGDNFRGYIITNSKEEPPTETTQIKVDKKWVGKAQEQVTVKLLANGKEVASQVLNKENQWQHTFTNLAKKDKDNKTITYTIEEEKIEGYTSEISGDQEKGYTITNTEKTVPPEENTEVSVNKVWIGKMQEKAIIKLMANGKEVASQELNAKNNWHHTFKNLAKKDKDGKDITYSITEEQVAGYQTEISGSVEKGYLVINREIPTTPPPTTEKPKPPTPVSYTPNNPVPNTGDTQQPMQYAWIMSVAIGVLVMMRRRKRSRD